jgi:hypothetical protein
MSTNTPNTEQIQSAMTTSLREHWVLFLVEGIILVVLEHSRLYYRFLCGGHGFFADLADLVVGDPRLPRRRNPLRR